MGTQNYERLLTDDQFWGSMHNTLLYIISMTIIPVLLGLVLASLLFDYIRDQFGERRVELLPRRRSICRKSFR